MPSTLVGLDQPSGLLTSSTGKRMKVLTMGTWRKVLRLIRDTKLEGFKATFSCPECRQEIHMTVPDPRSPRLECGCTQWIGR